jgi:hypothetical protein
MWETAPNPGRIRIYTSGWPKNQNKCWYKIGSPPPTGSKKEVFRFRSVSSIVIPPARTGREIRRSTVVTATAQTKRGMRSGVKPLVRMFFTVVIKLIDLKMEEIPAK